MGAAPPGQIILTLSDDTGTVTVTIFTDPDGSGAFDQNPALTAVNGTGSAQRVDINMPNGAVHSVNVPRGTHSIPLTTVTNLGVTNFSQLNGISFSLE
jgi:hypothetical protein